MSNVGKISTTTASTVNCTENFVLLIVLCLTLKSLFVPFLRGCSISSWIRGNSTVSCCAFFSVLKMKTSSMSACPFTAVPRMDEPPYIRYGRTPYIRYGRTPYIRYGRTPNIRYGRIPNIRYGRIPNIRYGRS